MTRAFLALWPDDAVRARLAAACVPLVPSGCRAVPARNLHLTLVFVGEVADAALAVLAGCLPDRPIEPFDLRFGDTGSFARARVGWAAPVAPPDALFALQRTLAARVAAAGFATDARPYAPHVTIARGCAHSPLRWDGPEVAWRVDRVALCRSDGTPSGVRYSVVAMR